VFGYPMCRNHNNMQVPITIIPRSNHTAVVVNYLSFNTKVSYIYYTMFSKIMSIGFSRYPSLNYYLLCIADVTSRASKATGLTTRSFSSPGAL